MRIVLSMMLLMCFLLMIGCQAPLEPFYTDNEPIFIEMKQSNLRILQLTDVHLTYGIDYNDRATYRAIETLVLSENWDLVVFTGDIVMSPLAIPLFNRLVRLMESLETHWTFVLGNHDRDYHSAERLLSITQETTYLQFKVGPDFEDDSAGNFKITFTQNDEPYYHLYFLDTKSETDHPERTSDYDFLSEAQVAWYEAFVQEDTVDHLVFMHTPLIQFELVENYTGHFGEPVHPQGLETGFFETALTYGRTRGIFVGHDHENDFSFMLDGVLLAYGRFTGLNAYGSLEIGGRVIEISEDKVLNTYILPLSEVAP